MTIIKYLFQTKKYAFIKHRSVVMYALCVISFIVNNLKIHVIILKKTMCINVHASCFNT